MLGESLPESHADSGRHGVWSAFRELRVGVNGVGVAIGLQNGPKRADSARRDVGDCCESQLWF